MTRHLTDHRSDHTTGRTAQFLRIARSQSQTLWHRLWQAHPDRADPRRVVEFIRIERQPQDLR